MCKKKIFAALFFILGWFGLLQAQNPNLVTTENGVSYEASSANPNPPSRGRALNLGREAFQSRWETDKEIEGAWVQRRIRRAGKQGNRHAARHQTGRAEVRLTPARR